MDCGAAINEAAARLACRVYQTMKKEARTLEGKRRWGSGRETSIQYEILAGVRR